MFTIFSSKKISHGGTKITKNTEEYTEFLRFSFVTFAYFVPL